MGFSEVSRALRPWEESHGTQAAVSLLFSCGQSRGSQMLMKPLVLLDTNVCLVLAFLGVDTPTHQLSV